MPLAMCPWVSVSFTSQCFPSFVSHLVKSSNKAIFEFSSGHKFCIWVLPCLTSHSRPCGREARHRRYIEAVLLWFSEEEKLGFLEGSVCEQCCGGEERVRQDCEFEAETFKE